MRTLAITGMVTVAMISRMILDGGHARDAAFFANVGGHAFQRHHCAGAGVLRDLGLFGGGDVHDHAALEHLGEANFHAPFFGAGISVYAAICFFRVH